MDVDNIGFNILKKALNALTKETGLVGELGRTDDNVYRPKWDTPLDRGWDAEIKIEEAKGIAQAQKIINETLTTNYLQHEAIKAQEKMAGSPNHTTVYIPVGANGMPVVYTPK